MIAKEFFLHLSLIQKKFVHIDTPEDGISDRTGILKIQVAGASEFRCEAADVPKGGYRALSLAVLIRRQRQEDRDLSDIGGLLLTADSVITVNEFSNASVNRRVLPRKIVVFFVIFKEVSEFTAEERNMQMQAVP